MRRKLPLIALLLVQACEPAADVEPLDCDNPVPGISIVGKGNLETGFKDLEDGADLLFVLRPQGMHMIMLSARIFDMEPAQAGGIGNRVTVAVRHEGVVVGGTVADMQPSLVAGEATDFLGVRAVFTAAEIDLLDQEVADVEITVRDGCGRELVAERPLQLTL